MKLFSPLLLLFSGIFLFFSAIVNAQISQGVFTIGGLGVDEAYSIIQTRDGGYAITGYTNSYGSGDYDIYVAKLDVNFALQWSATVGGTYREYGNSIIQTNDGGYAIAGYTQSYGNGLYLVKLDSSGNLKWTRTAVSYYGAKGASLVQTKNGDYVVTGNFQLTGGGNYKVLITVFDSLGNFKWSKTYGGSGSEYGNAIILAKDGGYAIAGHTDSYGAGTDDVYVLKLDSAGGLQWTKTIGGTNLDEGYSIVQSPDGGYVVSGATISYGAGRWDVYIVKLNSSGTLEWTRTIGGIDNEQGNSVIGMKDGGFLVGGYSNTFDVNHNGLYLVKVDSSGTVQWTKTYYDANAEDYLYSIIHTNDGGYAAGGYIYHNGNYDMYIIKLDSSFNTCLPVETGATVGTGGAVSGGGVVDTGGTPSTGGLYHSGGTVSTLCSSLTTGTINITAPSIGAVLYPVPATNLLFVDLSVNNESKTLQKNVTIEITDVLGREVLSLPDKDYSSDIIILNISELNPGMYFVRIRTANTETVKKFIKE